jgi:hypothetical protein
MFKHLVPTKRKTRLHYNDQLANAVYGNNCCLYWKAYDIHKYTVAKRRIICLLKQAVRTLGTGLLKVKLN